MPELGSYLCWIPGLRAAPCDPGFSWSPRSGPRLERRRQKERSRVSAAGLSGPPTCLAPRGASLRGCPLFASVPNSETTQTPAEAAGHLGAQILSGRAGPRGWGRPGEGARSGLGGVGTARWLCCPTCHFTRSPALSSARPHILPISVFLLGGSRLSCLIPVRSYFQLSSLEPCRSGRGSSCSSCTSAPNSLPAANPS